MAVKAFSDSFVFFLFFFPISKGFFLPQKYLYQTGDSDGLPNFLFWFEGKLNKCILHFLHFFLLFQFGVIFLHHDASSVKEIKILGENLHFFFFLHFTPH